jgi:hypothetical protein
VGSTSPFNASFYKAGLNVRKEVEEYRLQSRESKNERYVLLRRLAAAAPSDPQLFYEDFGLFNHPFTNEPVKQLAYYQKEFWTDIDRYHYAMAIKSNKIGISSLTLLNLFYHMITDCAGYQALIIAQSSRMSREHLYTLEKMVGNSEKYRDFMISIGDRDVNVGRGEQTRITEMFIRNPNNPRRPTRVISIPAVAGAAVSWKEVKYIMASDITMTERDYDPVVKSAFTRLAQTRGYFIIESIPNGPQGIVYDIWLRNRTQQTNDFKVREYPVSLAVAEGLISEEFLEGEKRRHGIDFDRLYNCSFAIGAGNVFDLKEIDKCVDAADYDPFSSEFVHNMNYPKSMGIDPGYRTSKAGIIILQMRNGFIEVLDATELEQTPNSMIVDYVYNQMLRFGIENVYADASAAPFISDLKNKINETAYIIMKSIDDNPQISERIIPVPFNPLNKPMLIHANNLVSDGYVKIHKGFQGLVNQCKIAKHIDGKLSKTQREGETLDLLDAFFMALLRFDYVTERQK